MTVKHPVFSADSGRRKILVVEDEYINREMLRLMIQDDYDVMFAETGEQAIELAEENQDVLSLVLLDLNLPDMMGVDILRKMKDHENTARLPVIVMTADAEAEVECLIMGATDFIPKPYPKKEVVLARMLRTIELYEERDIIRETERDHLTGLYNREFFYRYAAQFDQYHTSVSTDAVFMDINHFHVLNERYGRDYGDAILKRIADCLQDIFSDDGIVSRSGGDTFLVYCKHRNSYDDILENVTSAAGEENQVRIRIGIYADTDREIELERRFDRAKIAADTVKNSYTQTIAIYDDSLHEKEIFEEQLIESFHKAIQENQFDVYFQPKFDISSEEPVLSSTEALVRWKHPEFGMVNPATFIPLFEENGLISELDSYVWRKAAFYIGKWKKEQGLLIPVSVNVSRIDLYEPKLPETLESLTKEYGVSNEELHLEITESAYTENSDQIISVVKQLQQRGFYIEMDDFGTGYSSLNMLSTLPIDVLKLDMDFIRTAFTERKDTRLIEAIIGLAGSLDLPTIAEGVETEDQMLTLKELGCDVIQGYYFSRPLPADEFEAFVRDQDDSVIKKLKLD